MPSHRLPNLQRPGLLALALLATPLAARAWSEPAHRIVGEIAEARLSPAGRALVREILGARRLSDAEVAMWADEIRTKRTAPWHYVNVPYGAARYDPDRDCPRGGCAVRAAEEAAARLRDGDDAIALADALRWLVHLVGDLHQPMHAGERRDRGGNETWVRIGKRRQPLSVHRLWDAVVVEPLLDGAGPLRAARDLTAASSPADVAAWTAELSPAAWATESHLLARAIARELRSFPVDDDRIVLPAGYPAAQRARTAAQLSKAGARLAALLDGIAAERAAGRPH